MSKNDEDGCACAGDAVRAQDDPAYRRALWIVVILNIGFGLCEIIGGFVADSQALKADALDFLGDGSITLIGLFALGWTALARSRVALVQGIFLGLLGIGVIGFAIWRAMSPGMPEAGIMGVIGFVALGINIASAYVLSQFRDGDANVQAIWLFSRNDAIANVAVIGAAGLVAWTGKAWPDIAVAAVIAMLFIHSAYQIIQNAVAEMQLQNA
ncbi:MULTISPECIES: cation transporter [Sphingomonadaceae]|jgi:cation diffusion facilitator family transporter|uniref:Cation transporter n=1 Tax=Parasphingorhabdus flavimaris TaxID=266812 RepID=A0ABX2N3Q1_9SPHN|nr:MULTISPECIES: cation transporter [Sphingomonadaceae]ATW03740.1 cation transporter [Sphingorhabdus sp. YGSMI21]NVD28350.1 cation transporter [Parasphingorhabdus flavimaris]VWX59656.1 Cation transporter [Sphingorhabdus sp. 109]|tara:strand:- start:8193 stop:8828 length:636 start_codon:yes stop_codon:yes gene_type:complete